jgi:hypothetical protein
MPKQQSEYVLNAQPIAWRRAFVAGMCSSLIMMMFIDIFYMMGATPFCLEVYVGSLLRDSMYGEANWTVGFFFNLVMGGVFGWIYGFFFEDVYKRAGSRNGIFVGFFHAILAAVAILPFFGIVGEQMGIREYPHFGFFGSGLTAAAPLVLLFSHLLFGATMGIFYGPVRMDRIRARFMEPEDTQYENTDAA